MDTWEEWRRNGLQLQLVSRWVLLRLGFQIVKAQEDPATPALESRLRKLSPYLKDYSDYIVSKQGRLQIVEVKAPVTLPILKRPFGSEPVKFTHRQMQEFRASPVPVKVLLWSYGLASSLLELQSRVFYALLDFRDLERVETLADAVTMRLPTRQRIRPRWIMPATLGHLLRQSMAMRVKDITPGRIICD